MDSENSILKPLNKIAVFEDYVDIKKLTAGFLHAVQPTPQVNFGDFDLIIEHSNFYVQKDNIYSIPIITSPGDDLTDILQTGALNYYNTGSRRTLVKTPKNKKSKLVNMVSQHGKTKPVIYLMTPLTTEQAMKSLFEDQTAFKAKLRDYKEEVNNIIETIHYN